MTHHRMRNGSESGLFSSEGSCRQPTSFLAVLRPPWPPASSTSLVARRHPPRPACYRRRFPSPAAARRSARLLDPRRRMPRLPPALRHQHPYPKRHRRHPPAPHASPRACPSSTFRRTTRAPRRHRPGAARRGSTPSRPTTPSCTTVCSRPGSCSIPPWSIRCGTTTGTADDLTAPGTPRPTRSATGTSARRGLPGTSYWFGMVRFEALWFCTDPARPLPTNLLCHTPVNGCAQYTHGRRIYLQSPDPTT